VKIPVSIALCGMVAIAVGLFFGCATYRYAKNVKLISFSEDITKGGSLGQIEADDCVFSIFVPLGTAPTFPRAMENLKKQRRSHLADVVGGERKGADKNVRYVTNVSSEYEGFGVSGGGGMSFGKNCIVVTGTGYQ
jgi:hypothetical protein